MDVTVFGLDLGVDSSDLGGDLIKPVQAVGIFKLGLVHIVFVVRRIVLLNLEAADLPLLIRDSSLS